MTRLFHRADSILRGDSQWTQTLPPGRALTQFIVLIVWFGVVYGAVMGSFGVNGTERLLQVVYSALKVPLLLLLTFLLSLPSFFVFNTLAGVRADFPQALRALAASQAGLTMLLASLAPLTLLWNFSSSDHNAAILFNALMFGVATGGGQLLLRRYYRPLLERDARHWLLLRLWGFLYAFIGIQMGWILRPFVGDPSRPVSFFREDTWGNAYIILFGLIRELFRR